MLLDRSRGIALGLVACLALGWAVGRAASTPARRSELTDLIAERDGAMFAAFNDGDLEGVMALFDDDLEFYHDDDGLLFYDDVVEGFKSLFAQDNGLRRELVPGTLRVYPVPGYGAIEVGSHRFCHDENGKQVCGVFDFTHVWSSRDGRWRVTRVLSYSH